MVRNYEIGDVSIDNDYSLMRNVQLKTERTKLNSFARAVTPDLTEKFIRDTYSTKFKDGVLEVFLPLTLEKLREIDSSDENRKNFLTKRFPEHLQTSSLLRVIVLMIQLKDTDKISDEDVEYINDLLMWEANDLYITPLLKFSDGFTPETRLSVYNDFIKRLLEQKNAVTTSLRVGISVPFFYQRRKVVDIFKLYEKENKKPQFVLIDFEKSRLTSTSMIGKIQRVKASFNAEKEEKYFIHAFNMKPHKRGEEKPFAEDMGIFLSGLNSLGKTYRTSPEALIFRAFPYPQAWGDLAKTFGEDDYKYHELAESKRKDKFVEWSNRNLGTEINAEILNPKYPYYKNIIKYNIYELNVEASDLSAKLISNDKTAIKDKLSDKTILTELKHKFGEKPNKTK